VIPLPSISGIHLFGSKESGKSTIYNQIKKV
jgi:hypothetical protein